MEAKKAIWIVARPRAEHIKAVTWLNESNLADFYLLKIEAIKIGDSDPAPLLTLISGPSEESRRIGETKKDLSERHILRKKWWTELLEKAKSKTKLHANISPREYNWLSASAGKSGLVYNYFVLQHQTGIELYIDCGNKNENERIFDKLHQQKEAVEKVFGSELQWEKLEAKKACRIAKSYEDGGYRSEEGSWPNLQDNLINSMILLHKALSPHVRGLNITS